MHIASAGGTWQMLVCGFGGFRVLHGQMSFTPWLPADWQEIRFRLRWRGSTCTSRSTTATSNCCSAATPAARRRYWSAAGR